MWRVVLLIIGVLAATWLEFEVYPGHSYLEGDSQIYLPMLERLDAPGYLSRDPVAAHPDVTYTVYDEVTLLLHEAGRLKFKTALEGQQLFCRGCAVTGVLLLAQAAGAGDLLALLLAAFVNLGAMLCGPALPLMDREPAPRAFAYALVLLAAGLLADKKPLLAGLAGGIGLVYDPIVAAPLCIVMVLAVAIDKQMRRVLRPALTILAIFILLLANLAQLQPGVAESAASGRLTAQLAAIAQYRTPSVWVSLWPPADFWSYLAIYVCGLWATARSWPVLNRPLRWLLLALPLGGILTVPASYIGLERLHWYLVPRIQPTQALLFTVAFSSIACGIAGAHAAKERKPWEASLWFVVVFAIAVHSEILDLLRVNRAPSLRDLAVCLGLAIATGATAAVFSKSRWRYASLLIPVFVVSNMPKLAGSHPLEIEETQSLAQLATWAETSTWGSSMFLFPDAGRDIYPGTFRAESRRAVWVDWNSGVLVDRFESFAGDWWERWRQTMQGRFSAERLQTLLPLPIDYYVLKSSNRLEIVRPVFLNRDYVVYDAADLRRSSAALRLAELRPGSGRRSAAP